jgi:hypothetical protein
MRHNNFNRGRMTHAPLCGDAQPEPGYMNVVPQHTEIRVRCKTCGEEREFDRFRLPLVLRHALVEDVEARLK